MAVCASKHTHTHTSRDPLKHSHICWQGYYYCEFIASGHLIVPSDNMLSFAITKRQQKPSLIPLNSTKLVPDPQQGGLQPRWYYFTASKVWPEQLTGSFCVEEKKDVQILKETWHDVVLLLMHYIRNCVEFKHSSLWPYYLSTWRADRILPFKSISLLRAKTLCLHTNNTHWDFLTEINNISLFLTHAHTHTHIRTLSIQGQRSPKVCTEDSLTVVIYMRTWTCAWLYARMASPQVQLIYIVKLREMKKHTHTHMHRVMVPWC